MHQKILERILAKEPTKYITPGSTPVISFGDFTTATLATLGINPSSKEFLAGDKLRVKGKKRLSDKESLGIGIGDPIREEHAPAIWNGCINYFSPSGHRYAWFKDLDQVLIHTGRSYADGSTCHIDLVQWATSPAWKEIPKDAQPTLIEQDFNFFKFQVAQENLRTLVVNGRAVYNVISKIEGFNIEIVGKYEYKIDGKATTSELFEGAGPGNKKVLGWTGTLKSLRISPSERERIYSMLASWISARL